MPPQCGQVAAELSVMFSMVSVRISAALSIAGDGRWLKKSWIASCGNLA
jgi:hypothetical protein